MPRLALAVAALLGSRPRPPASAQTAAVPPHDPGEVRLSFAPIVKKVRPAVVNVYASRVETMPRNPLFDDPIFRQFFGDQGQNSRTAQSLGSGVIVDPSGLVVTNHHVIEGMTEVKIALSDRREFEATIVLRDPRTDLAVLKIKSDEKFPVLELGDSDAIEVGDFVSRSAIRSASARPSRRASSPRSRAPRSASTTTASSSRPTQRSIPAIPAARWSISRANWWASIRRSIRARAAAWASASRFPSTWSKA